MRLLWERDDIFPSRLMKATDEELFGVAGRIISNQHFGIYFSAAVTVNEVQKLNLEQLLP